MVSSWIRDKVVSTVEADVKENGGDANEVIWQLSKDLKKMVQIGAVGTLADQEFNKKTEDLKARHGRPVKLTYTPVPEEFRPESLQALSDYELAELGVNLQVERQRRIDVRHESTQS